MMDSCSKKNTSNRTESSVAKQIILLKLLVDEIRHSMKETNNNFCKWKKNEG